MSAPLPTRPTLINKRLFLAMLSLAGTMLSVTVANAQSCQTLWIERNSYYKEGGYCFKSQRAIARFGNAGCQYDREAEVPLSQNVRARIAEINALERRQGCD